MYVCLAHPCHPYDRVVITDSILITVCGGPAVTVVVVNSSVTEFVQMTTRNCPKFEINVLLVVLT